MSYVRLSTRRELELMQHLQQLANHRAQEEKVLAAALATQLADAERDFNDTAQRLNEDSARRRGELESEFSASRQTAAALFDKDRQEADQVRIAVRKASDDRHAAIVAAAEHAAKDADWQALAVYDGVKNHPQQGLDEAVKRIQARRRQVDGLERDAQTLREMRRPGGGRAGGGRAQR